MFGKVLRHPATVDPHEQIDAFMHFGCAYIWHVHCAACGQVCRQLLVRQLGCVKEHIVIEYVVVDGDQVHPIARLRYLQQAALVHVLVVKPKQRSVDMGPLLGKKLCIVT